MNIQVQIRLRDQERSKVKQRMMTFLVGSDYKLYSVISNLSINAMKRVGGLVLVSDSIKGFSFAFRAISNIM